MRSKLLVPCILRNSARGCARRRVLGSQGRGFGRYAQDSGQCSARAQCVLHPASATIECADSCASTVAGDFFFSAPLSTQSIAGGSGALLPLVLGFAGDQGTIADLE